MTAFQIIDNIEVPATVTTRNRPRGPFAAAVDSLQVGQGFLFDSDKALKSHYPKVSPSKFPSDTPGMNKKFKLWIAGEGKVGVKRLEDVTEAEAKAQAKADGAGEGADNGAGEGAE